MFFVVLNSFKKIGNPLKNSQKLRGKNEVRDFYRQKFSGVYLTELMI